jgi:hypothetical protein
MGNLCISMHFTARCTPCIAFKLVIHACAFAIDHVEQERMEPAPVEGADYEQDQAKPRCI